MKLAYGVITSEVSSMSLLALLIALFASFQLPVFKEHVKVTYHPDVCASGSCVDGGTGSVH